MPEDLAAYTQALTPHNTADSVYLIGRRWQLTNTRYLLGPVAFLNAINEDLDPAQHRLDVYKRQGQTFFRGGLVNSGATLVQWTCICLCNRK